MGYARIGVAVVGGEADGDDDAGGSPVVVSADPSVRGRARNPRITKWTSIATNVPELSISSWGFSHWWEIYFIWSVSWSLSVFPADSALMHFPL